MKTNIYNVLKYTNQPQLLKKHNNTVNYFSIKLQSTVLIRLKIFINAFKIQKSTTLKY